MKKGFVGYFYTFVLYLVQLDFHSHSNFNSQHIHDYTHSISFIQNKKLMKSSN